MTLLDEYESFNPSMAKNQEEMVIVNFIHLLDIINRVKTFNSLMAKRTGGNSYCEFSTPLRDYSFL